MLLAHWIHVAVHTIFKLYTFSKWIRFWNVHGIMNTSGLLQTLQNTRSIHDSNFARDLSIYDSMNIPQIEFIAYIYILL